MCGRCWCGDLHIPDFQEKGPCKPDENQSLKVAYAAVVIERLNII